MQIKFRQAIEADLDFLDEMHTECMKEHMLRVYQWNPHLFRQTFKPQHMQIILVNGAEVGMLQFSTSDKELYFGYLPIFPEFQNRGIGSGVLRHVLEQGRLLNLPVKLQVLKQNPALRLYKRLGFEVTEETSTHHIMLSHE